MKGAIIFILFAVLLSGCGGVMGAYGEIVDKPSIQDSPKIADISGDRYKIVIKSDNNTYTFRVSVGDYELVDVGSKVYFEYWSSGSYWKAELTPITDGKGVAD